MAKAIDDNGNQVNLDLRYAKKLVCKNCGGADFYTSVRLSILPKIAYGLSKDELVVLEGMVCAKCNSSIENVTELAEEPAKQSIIGIQ